MGERTLKGELSNFLIDKIIEHYKENFSEGPIKNVSKVRRTLEKCLEIDSNEKCAQEHMADYFRTNRFWEPDMVDWALEYFNFLSVASNILKRSGKEFKIDYGFIYESYVRGEGESRYLVTYLKNAVAGSKGAFNNDVVDVGFKECDEIRTTDLQANETEKHCIESNLTEEEGNDIQDIKEEAHKSEKKSKNKKRKSITMKVDNSKLEALDEEEIIHEKLGIILQFVSAKEPVYLVGPAGSGKNYICKQVAKMLGLNFYFSNAVTQEYKITGFTDANGIYHESQFYKAFKNGGLFMVDEMDASISETLIILNAAIANGYFDFPAPIGYVEAHEDFRIVAAGNTYGYGADMQYVGRNQLDMASLDRFAVVEIAYSSAIEEAICPNYELLEFLREFRKVALHNGIMTVVSYRAMKRMFIMEKAINSKSELLDTCLCKGLSNDDLRLIYNQLTVRNKYTNALLKLIRSKS